MFTFSQAVSCAEAALALAVRTAEEQSALADDARRAREAVITKPEITKKMSTPR